MIDKYESAYNNLFSLIQEFDTLERSDFNEATTRFRFIDRIVTECLAWDHADITTEDSYQGDYSDYTLRLFRPVAVLEAKRTGNYFELPLGIKNLIIPIRTLIKDNPNIKAVLNQVSGYCNSRFPHSLFFMTTLRKSGTVYLNLDLKNNIFIKNS